MKDPHRWDRVRYSNLGDGKPLKFIKGEALLPVQWRKQFGDYFFLKKPG
jgi:hypothetical protein